MHWQIKLEDQNGHFWFTDRDPRMWSDSAEDAFRFTREPAARHAADLVRARVAGYIDWFPRVKIVQFLDS